MSKQNATKILPGPCHAEAEESRKCMEGFKKKESSFFFFLLFFCLLDAKGVKSKCTDKFLAYKDCKSKIYVAKQKERDDVFFGKK